MTGRITSAAFAIGASVSCAASGFAIPVASARPSDPGVVSYAILGKGSVGIERFVKKLKEIGYKAPLNIEREAESEEERIKDMREAVPLLRSFLQ